MPSTAAEAAGRLRQENENMERTISMLNQEELGR